MLYLKIGQSVNLKYAKGTNVKSLPTSSAIMTLVLASQAEGDLSRNAICEIVWGESFAEKGRVALRTTLSDLRRFLGDDFSKYFSVTRSTVSLAKNLLQVRIEHSSKILSSITGRSNVLDTYCAQIRRHILKTGMIPIISGGPTPLNVNENPNLYITLQDPMLQGVKQILSEGIDEYFSYMGISSQLSTSPPKEDISADLSIFHLSICLLDDRHIYASLLSPNKYQIGSVKFPIDSKYPIANVRAKLADSTANAIFRYFVGKKSIRDSYHFPLRFLAWHSSWNPKTDEIAFVDFCIERRCRDKVAISDFATRCWWNSIKYLRGYSSQLMKTQLEHDIFRLKSLRAISHSDRAMLATGIEIYEKNDTTSLQIYRDIYRDAPNEIVPLLLYVEAAVRTGETSVAHLLIAQARSQRSSGFFQEKLLFFSGLLYLQDESFPDAYEVFDYLIKKRYNWPCLHRAYIVACHATGKGDLQEAVEFFRKKVAIDFDVGVFLERHPDARFAVGRSFLGAYSAGL